MVFLYFAFNAVHSPLEATDQYEARFPHITDGKRKTYAGMLAAMDDAIGRVMAKVRELGQEENTLVFFYSDNGGPTPETTRQRPAAWLQGSDVRRRHPSTFPDAVEGHDSRRSDLS